MNIVASIIRAQIGTPIQSNLIEDHMKEYFKRWPNYEKRLTNLEWYHLFLDFYDKILDNTEEIDDKTVHAKIVGTLKTTQGIKGYISAKVGDSVFEENDKYFIFMDEGKHKVSYYKTTLQPHIKINT